ncbi:MAG: TonB-dependent receptor plug domain-containing protein, partial [Candidatus Delongbacteria bacterium]|nr:TonB-dependent receptor plug domain-containing protein [Candidatus Delongbacteria bacterium]
MSHCNNAVSSRGDVSLKIIFTSYIPASSRIFNLTALLLLLVFGNLFSGSRFIGIVTDKTGLPVSDVNIQLLPTTYGISSDENGEFVFNRIEAGVYTLKLSHVNFQEKTIEISVTSSKKIDLKIKLNFKCIDLDEIIVFSDKMENVNLKIISSRKIEESNINNLEDILKNSTALDVTQTINGQTKISIRGSESKQVTVMIDGVSVNSKMTGSFDLNSIPKEMIERIEIYKGGNIELTSQAIGGIINIVTKRNFSFEEFNSSVSYSNIIYQSDRDEFQLNRFNNHSSSINSGFSVLSHNVLFSVTYKNFKNEWSYINASPFDSFRPNPPKNHSNSYNNIFNSFLSISKKSNNFNYNYMFNYSNNLYGMPGDYPNPYFYSYKEMNDFKNRVNFEYIINDESILKTDVYYYFGKQYFYIDSFDNLYSRRDDSDKFSDIGLKINYSNMIYNSKLRTGIEFLRESMESEMLQDKYHKRDIYSVFLSLDKKFEYKFDDFVFSIKPLLGTRSEYYSNLKEILTFSSYGVLISVKYSSFLFFTKLRYSQNHRLPSFSSLFWADNQFSSGSSDLRPEFSETKELESGISYDLGKNSISGNFEIFQKDIKDLIVWERTWQEIYRPINLLKGYVFGTETSISYSYDDDMISCTATYQTLENLHGTSQKYHVVYKPLSKVKLLLSYNYKDLSININNDYTGIMYINSV